METITITFGDVAENHVGMEKLGKKRHNGFFVEDLVYVKSDLEELGYDVTLVDLVAESKFDSSHLEPAAILVIKNGVSLFTETDLWHELSALDWDKKMFNARRKVVQQKIARHNLCFADIETIPKYEEGRGRVYNFKDLPGLKEIRDALPEIFGYTGYNLVAEGNRYYNIKKCGIGFHGDSERKVVIGFRFGEDFPLEYQWYHKSLPVGERIKIELGDQDVYVMSEKAVGSDWMKSSLYTLRHAAGFHKRFIKPS